MANTTSFFNRRTGEPLSSGMRVGGGHFVLKRLLGRSELSEVWLAQDVMASREVALKFVHRLLLADNAVLECIREETQRCGRLVHPHIVAVRDFIRDDTAGAIVMDYVDGWSLAALKVDKPQRRYRVEEIEWWIRQLCVALEYAHHEFGFVHRDLKPSNLLVNAHDELKVADFGIAHCIRRESSRLGLPLAASSGIAFHSPQQITGEAPSLQDDMYSLGATMFDLLTGTPPFYDGDIPAQIASLKAPGVGQRLRELGAKGSRIPPAWEQAVAACLAKNPAERPKSISEFLQLLDQSAGQRPISSPLRP